MAWWFHVSNAVVEAQRALSLQNETDRLYYCYRCRDCGRLITKIELLEGRFIGIANTCPCGCRRMNPSNAKLWEELLLPRCWKLIFAIYTHRIAPPPARMTEEEQAEANRTARAAMRAFERQMVRDAAGKS